MPLVTNSAASLLNISQAVASNSFTVGFWINCEFIGAYDTIVGSPANTGGLLYALVSTSAGTLM